MNTAFAKCVLIIALLIVFGATSCMAAVIYVKPESSPARTTHNGASWSTAYASIKDAVARASSGTEIWVAQGAYKADSLILPVGAKLYGGFSGSETSRDQRNSDLHETALLTSGLYIANDTKGLCVVDGFTIDTNGNTGIYLISSGSTISNNSVTDCSYGILCLNGAPVITGNRLWDNTYGIICTGTTAKLYNNLVSDCTTTGIDCRTKDAATIVNNTIVSSGQGIGVYVRDGSPTLANNIVAYWPQAGLRVAKTAKPVLSHNCVYGNGTNYDGAKADSGSISADPNFVDRTGFDLAIGSPCIDTGDDAYVLKGEIDCDGQPRLCGLHVDIGADESWVTPPGTPVVIDDGLNQLSADSLHAVWRSSGGSGTIVEYDYAIGTSPTYTEGMPLTVGWTSAGAHTGATLMSLHLRDDPGLKYYFYVKAKSSAGLWSPVGVSGGVRVTDLEDKDYLLGIGGFEESHLVKWYSSVPNSDLVTLSPSPSIYVDPTGQGGYLSPKTTDKQVADGWTMVTTGTPTPYANTNYRIDRTNRFGAGNSQYVGLRGQLKGYTSAWIVCSLPIDATQDYALHPGDTVTLRIDSVQMSDFAGASVGYHINLGAGSKDVVLKPSATPFACSTAAYTIPTGTSRIDVTLMVDTGGQLNGHSPGIYVDGAHLTVRRAGEAGNERWAVPVRPVRNVKTQYMGYNDYRIDIYAAARDYGCITEHDSEWSSIGRLRRLSPNLRLYLYKSGASAVDVRDAIPGGNDIPFDPNFVSFWDLTNPQSPLYHPDWLFPDGRGGYLVSDHPSRYPVRVDNTDYQKLWVASALARLSDLGYDGIWVDDVGTDPVATQDARWAHSQQLVHSVYPGLKSAGFTVIQNAASRHLDGAGDWDGGDGRILCDPFWTTTSRFTPALGYANNTPENVADVDFQEYAFFEVNGGTNYFGRDYWLRCLGDMDVISGWNTARDSGGKLLLSNTQKRQAHLWVEANDLAGEPAFGLDGWIGFGLCSYLLCQNDWTSIGFGIRDSGYVKYPYLDYSVTKRLGVPDGARKQISATDPYWQYRNYKSTGPGEAGGVVVVNGDTAAARTYTVPFDADMAELGNGQTLFTFVPANTSIRVPVNSGRILIRH